jgi:ABC-type lipoprotein export system ATPase subunit/GNAT superfamily N-acetyltransferase
MPAVDLVVESKIENTFRVKQLGALFDVPLTEKSKLEWHGDFDIDAAPWSVGLIVGPSGCGKSLLTEKLFGSFDEENTWSDKKAVIDDFDSKHSVQEISAICQAIGFNTIPAWLRPYRVLSNGEKFRVDMARRMIDGKQRIIVDEFTSVVDRQVAKIASNSIQKYIRKNGKQFVAASCHYDIIDWLQPDWILEPSTMTLTRRLLQRRPTIQCTVSPVDHSAWSIFKKYHYMSADLHKGARCWCLFVEDRPAAFVGVLFRPTSNGKRNARLQGVSRLVTLPDYQGLGLAFVLLDFLGGIYAANNEHLKTYPAHPALIKSFYRSKKWANVKREGSISKVIAPHLRSKVNVKSTLSQSTILGGRPNAVFEYIGPKGDRYESLKMLSYWRKDAQG